MQDTLSFALGRNLPLLLPNIHKTPHCLEKIHSAFTILFWHALYLLWEYAFL